MENFLRLNPNNADKLKKEKLQAPGKTARKDSLKGLQPWVEKYRPNKLDEVVYQSNVVNTLKNTKATGKLQHLLLYGPPGTGKTSTILALAKELFGDEYKQRVLELNASDERGISVVRDKIKKYSQKLITKVSDKNSPKFQIVILDEADSMTVDAQSALRRIIEDYTKNTRFCIICNYVSKIIDPIASRCAKFRFSPLSRESQFDRLKYIAQNEGVNVDDKVLAFLIDISEGDLRRSINLVQSIGQLGVDLLTPDLINDICGIVPDKEVAHILEVSRFEDADTIIKEADNFLSSGYDLRQLLTQLNELVACNTELSTDEKSAVCRNLLNSEASLLENSSANLVLYSLMAEIRRIFSMN